MSATHDAGDAKRSAVTDSVRPGHSASDRIRDQAARSRKTFRNWAASSAKWPRRSWENCARAPRNT